LQHGEKEQDVCHILVAYAQRLETDENMGLLPLRFLVDFSEILGFKPHFDQPNAKCFNLDAGVFQTQMNQHDRVVEGPAVELIAEILNNESSIDSANKSARELALMIILDYYKIHIPRFEKITSLEIVKEILNA